MLNVVSPSESEYLGEGGGVELVSEILSASPTRSHCKYITKALLGKSKNERMRNEKTSVLGGL